MKKLGLVLIGVLMICMGLQLGVAAYEPIADTELEQLSSIPDIGHLISVGLPSSPVYSKPGATDELSDRDIADLGDIRYGISLIGAKRSLQRPIGAASDGVWSNFNKGGKVLENGNWSGGTVTWITAQDVYYNVKGESGAADGIYVSLLTYNFGKKMQLDAFGYFTNNMNAFPRAADLYTSQDGKAWTLLGKYDGNKLRVEGAEFCSAGAESPADSLGGTTSVNPLWSLNGVSAQYLRIAIVKGCGAQASANPDNTYDGWSTKTSSVSIATREIVIFGVDPNPDEKPVFEPVEPSDENTEEVSEPEQTQENKPDSGEVTTAPETDSDTPSGGECSETEEKSAETSQPSKTTNEKGCQSAFIGKAAYVVLGCVGAGLFLLRRKKNGFRE